VKVAVETRPQLSFEFPPQRCDNCNVYHRGDDPLWLHQCLGCGTWFAKGVNVGPPAKSNLLVCSGTCREKIKKQIIKHLEKQLEIRVAASKSMAAMNLKEKNV
jgi:hypothetical protein